MHKTVLFFSMSQWSRSPDRPWRDGQQSEWGHLSPFLLIGAPETLEEKEEEMDGRSREKEEGEKGMTILEGAEHCIP